LRCGKTLARTVRRDIEQLHAMQLEIHRGGGGEAVKEVLGGQPVAAVVLAVVRFECAPRGVRVAVDAQHEAALGLPLQCTPQHAELDAIVV
jgi:hypothetical protein